MRGTSIPFKNGNGYEGFAESIGLMTLRDTLIHLEFETQDAFFGLIKSGVKNVEIPIDTIDEIGVKKSIWGNRIEMRLNKLDILQAVPGAQGAELKLSIARKHSDLAADLIRGIQLRIAEHDYEEALKAS